MDRGDGICIHLAEDMRTCSIYPNRPNYCRIDESYVLFANAMSRIEYYKANAEVCNTLKSEYHLSNIIVATTGE